MTTHLVFYNSRDIVNLRACLLGTLHDRTLSLALSNRRSDGDSCASWSRALETCQTRRATLEDYTGEQRSPRAPRVVFSHVRAEAHSRGRGTGSLARGTRTGTREARALPAPARRVVR